MQPVGKRKATGKRKPFGRLCNRLKGEGFCLAGEPQGGEGGRRLG
ncbi:hypothetical protein AB395_00002226 [Sinorhizobium fredii CCBAU 45436]|nr:hypothetical protein AB395_00002226 [Sinorhizobium fredii CCBAU 45436]